VRLRSTYRSGGDEAAHILVVREFAQLHDRDAIDVRMSLKGGGDARNLTTIS
jgi:hypothetical protein